MRRVRPVYVALVTALVGAIGAVAIAAEPVAIGPMATAVPTLSAWSKLKPEYAVEWSGEALGLLRGVPDAGAPQGWRLTNDVVKVIEYSGSGTVPQVSPGKIAGAAADAAIFVVDFGMPAARLDAQTRQGRVVQVVAAGRAWDETSPGVSGRIVDAADARVNHVWLTPHGAVLGALWAGSGAKVSVQDGHGVISYVRNGRSMRLLLNEALRPERVEMGIGGHKYAAEYSGYKDFVGYSVLCPTKMKQWSDGKLVMDLTVSYCAVGIYSPFPQPSLTNAASNVPAGKTPKRGGGDDEKPFWEEEGRIENIEPAKVPVTGSDGQLYPGVLRQNAPVRSEAAIKEWEAAKARPTPRIDGKPDFTGRWRQAAFLTPGAGGGPVGARPPPGKRGLYWNSRGASLLTMENDNYVRRRNGSERPLYKPEHWEHVRDLDLHALELDDMYHCRALGVARLGAPNFVMQDRNRISLLNATSGESYLQQFRLIAFQQGEAQKAAAPAGEPTPQGRSTARWDGDSLVIETTNLSDQTWLGRDGMFHSMDTRVIERLTRTGDTVKYEVTVEDPTVLAEPWVKAPRYYFVDSAPGLTIPDAQLCLDTNSEFVPGAVH